MLCKQVEAEMRKKSKGKGLSVLSGRALFDYDATLFQVDVIKVVLDTMILYRNVTLIRIVIGRELCL